MRIWRCDHRPPPICTERAKSHYSAIEQAWAQRPFIYAHQVISVGKLCVAAKHELNPGELKWLKQELSFKPPKFTWFTRIAECEWLSAYANQLPPCPESLYEVAKTPQPVALSLISKRRIGSTTSRKTLKEVLGPQWARD